MTYCEKCKSTNVIEAENGNYCCNCGWDSTKKEYVKKQTNADRIRSMDDKELAEFLCDISKCESGYCPAYNTCMRTERGTMKKWLQSEAE